MRREQICALSCVPRRRARHRATAQRGHTIPARGGLQALPCSLGAPSSVWGAICGLFQARTRPPALAPSRWLAAAHGGLQVLKPGSSHLSVLAALPSCEQQPIRPTVHSPCARAETCSAAQQVFGHLLYHEVTPEDRARERAGCSLPPPPTGARQCCKAVPLLHALPYRRPLTRKHGQQDQVPGAGAAAEA